MVLLMIRSTLWLGFVDVRALTEARVPLRPRHIRVVHHLHLLNIVHRLVLCNLIEVQVGGLALLIALLHKFHLIQLMIGVLKILVGRHRRALVRRDLRHLLLLVHLLLTVDFLLAAAATIVAGRVIKVQDGPRRSARRVRVVIRVVHLAVREAHG